MTKSMTAYAQASISTELGELSCELRTVNHRYLEIAPSTRASSNNVSIIWEAACLKLWSGGTKFHFKRIWTKGLAMMLQSLWFA